MKRQNPYREDSGVVDCSLSKQIVHTTQILRSTAYVRPSGFGQLAVRT